MHGCVFNYWLALAKKRGKKKLLPHYLKTLEDRNKTRKKRGEFKRE